MRKILLSLVMLGGVVLNSYADFISWDGNVLTLDYTTGKTLSSEMTYTENDEEKTKTYAKAIDDSGNKGNISKVIIKSDATNKFPASDLATMYNDWWNQNTIMDFTQALGIDGYLTTQNIRCQAIYLPSNIDFPANSVYVEMNSAWNQSNGLLYVCQLKDGELTVGGTYHNGTGDAVKEALEKNPLEYPFSEATHITMKGYIRDNDDAAVKAFNASKATLSYNISTHTLSLSNTEVSEGQASANIGTIVSSLSNLTSKADIQTIVFPDGSTYDFASGKLIAASSPYNDISTWLETNGFAVSSTAIKISDLITWDVYKKILTLDYTSGETMPDSNLDGYLNGKGCNVNDIEKVVIISDADNKFHATELGKMTNWKDTKIMDFTQAVGIDGDITSQKIKAKAIYLPSNIDFPNEDVYTTNSGNWNEQQNLMYVCQLDGTALTVGVGNHNENNGQGIVADAVKAALDKEPLEYPFSEATSIILVGNATQNDQNAVSAFSATTYDADTHTLTLSASDLSAGKANVNIDDIVSRLENLSSKVDIQVIKFPDGSTYDISTQILTAGNSSTNTSDNAEWLTKNGYTVTETKIGTYVSVKDGKTILNTNNESDVVTGNIDNSSKLSAAEKNALKAATNLVVKGTVTDDDWGGLQQISATTLDLTDAKIGSSCVLASKLRDNVQNLTLPNDANYTKVPDNFAYNALALQSVTFPGQITEIGDRAFFGCGNLASVDLPANLTTIGESAFQDSGLKTLVLPGKLTTVGKDAFFDCGQLENVEMKQLEGSCTFGDRAFGSCFQLKHITLSEGVNAISTQMFDKCSMLESIRIPSTCKTIGQEAFNICASLHSIVIPEGVDLIEKQAFTNSGITDIYVMATTKEKVPAIYSMGSSWGGNDSTFGSAMVTGNSHDPYNAHKDDIATADGETVLSWYQEEMSDGRLGVGGGDCLVRLHYPEEMRYFYDGFDNPLLTNGSWTPEVKDALSQAEIDAKKAVIDAGDTHYISEGYTVGTTQYPAFGPDKQGNYWPTRTDYLLRLQAGDPAFYEGSGLTEPSSLGWRQLPLHQVSKPDDFVFTKEYDDTWYTMCFPWDMEDNTLFSAFNQKLEIVEFVGAEVKEETTGSTKQLNLVFHFDEVAKAYYMTENHRTDELKYERVEDHIEDGKNTTRTENITIEGNVIKKKYYTYHRVNGTDGPEYVYWPFDLPAVKSSYTAEQKAMVDRYNSILHLMVFAGHPYMIHPSVGAKPNNPVICSIAGVKKLSATDYPNLASDNAVTKATTTDGTFQHPGTTYYDGQKSHYTFIGNVDEYAADATPAQKRKMMTDAEHPHAYFLAVDPTQSFYPKYYRKSKDNEKVASWSQYSAIIRPDAAAIADIEKYMNLNTNGSTPSSAKPFDIEFGKWEVVDVTAIEEIISEAERKNQTVEQVHLNVVFNIKGQVIREGSDSVEGLPKGLYIVNGKKYMVK